MIAQRLIYGKVQICEIVQTLKITDDATGEVIGNFEIVKYLYKGKEPVYIGFPYGGGYPLNLNIDSAGSCADTIRYQVREKYKKMAVKDRPLYNEVYIQKLGATSIYPVRKKSFNFLKLKLLKIC